MKELLISLNTLESLKYFKESETYHYAELLRNTIYCAALLEEIRITPCVKILRLENTVSILFDDKMSDDVIKMFAKNISPRRMFLIGSANADHSNEMEKYHDNSDFCTIKDLMNYSAFFQWAPMTSINTNGRWYYFEDPTLSIDVSLFVMGRFQNLMKRLNEQGISALDRISIDDQTINIKFKRDSSGSFKTVSKEELKKRYGKPVPLKEGILLEEEKVLSEDLTSVVVITIKHQVGESNEFDYSSTNSYTLDTHEACCVALLELALETNSDIYPTEKFTSIVMPKRRYMLSEIRTRLERIFSEIPVIFYNHYQLDSTTILGNHIKYDDDFDYEYLLNHCNFFRWATMPKYISTTGTHLYIKEIANLQYAFYHRLKKAGIERIENPAYSWFNKAKEISEEGLSKCVTELGKIARESKNPGITANNTKIPLISATKITIEHRLTKDPLPSTSCWLKVVMYEICCASLLEIAIESSAKMTSNAKTTSFIIENAAYAKFSKQIEEIQRLMPGFITDFSGVMPCRPYDIEEIVDCNDSNEILSLINKLHFFDWYPMPESLSPEKILPFKSVKLSRYHDAFCERMKKAGITNISNPRYYELCPFYTRPESEDDECDVEDSDDTDSSEESRVIIGESEKVEWTEKFCDLNTILDYYMVRVLNYYIGYQLPSTIAESMTICGWLSEAHDYHPENAKEVTRDTAWKDFIVPFYEEMITRRWYVRIDNYLDIDTFVDKHLHAFAEIVKSADITPKTRLLIKRIITIQAKGVPNFYKVIDWAMSDNE